MLIAIAGPYSAEDEHQKKMNLDKLNDAAALVYLKGHIPVIGVNAALPVADKLNEDSRYNVIMNISLELVSKCDAMLFLGESPGANKEKELMIKDGKKIFYKAEDIPDV